MPDARHRLQHEPPEGSRETIERELERQHRRSGSGEHEPRGGDSNEPRTSGRPPHEPKERGTKTVR